ncbi:hypothetical protein CAP31_11615 [Sulfuriferula sp. AH1]|uniref:polyamine aminopropyltransferase n=1 Tax=Sulfuriferula sp. AH1 TaxID=1985873 RepID=UPI000B3B65CD|nr:polyamine aminopropyltransferase [Sulfuriferula sp. AH1]ARU32263.1 hypothetical protein CAP31_11615 [Sulfuriferula sp. AH1]
MRFFKRRIHKAVSDLDTVEISEQNGIRYLHLGNDTVQSAMRIAAPNALELTYTQAMLGFLLFTETPANAMLIGLGGGSLTKFLYHQFPAMQLTAVEINPKVIQAARQFFFVPDDDERLRVTEADAAQFIVDQEGWDCILLDGFDAGFQVEALASTDFYSRCAQALTATGVLSVNLWGSDPEFDIYLQRLTEVFEQRIVCLPAEKRGNVLVFAFAAQPAMQSERLLQQRAQQLEAGLGLPFVNFLERLKHTSGNADFFK